jgi:phosphatidylglycerophosphate synthase
VVSLRELRSFPYRVNPEEPQKPYGRLLFRPISLYLTWICVNLGCSANQVTAGQLVIGVLAAAAVACPTLRIGILGLFLFQLGFMLDNIDGEIARFRKQASLTGKFLDEIGHQTVVPLMYLGFGVGDYLSHGRWEIIVFAALAGLSSLRIDLLSKAEVI